MHDRLRDQIDFILEIDRLKSILRQTTLVNEERRENSAEHSWHLATLAFLLHEYAPEPVDLLRVMKMVLIHDIVEIDAGDVFCYDADANVGKLDRERSAADRIFGLLPEDQGEELRSLWDEFEGRETKESRFANALDRLQAVLLNLARDGGSWRRHAISVEQVLDRNRPIGEGAPEIWEYLEARIRSSMSDDDLQG